MEVTEDEALSAAVDLLILCTFIALIAILILWGLTNYVALTITRPVHALRDAAALVASGDFDVYAPDTDPSEVGELARSFNTMTARLRRLYEDLAGQIEETRKSKALLQAIVDNSTALIAVSALDGRLMIANRVTLSGWSSIFSNRTPRP